MIPPGEVVNNLLQTLGLPLVERNAIGQERQPVFDDRSFDNGQYQGVEVTTTPNLPDHARTHSNELDFAVPPLPVLDSPADHSGTSCAYGDGGQILRVRRVQLIEEVEYLQTTQRASDPPVLAQQSVESFDKAFALMKSSFSTTSRPVPRLLVDGLGDESSLLETHEDFSEAFRLMSAVSQASSDHQKGDRSPPQLILKKTTIEMVVSGQSLSEHHVEPVPYEPSITILDKSQAEAPALLGELPRSAAPVAAQDFILQPKAMPNLVELQTTSSTTTLPVLPSETLFDARAVTGVIVFVSFVMLVVHFPTKRKSFQPVAVSQEVRQPHPLPSETEPSEPDDLKYLPSLKMSFYRSTVRAVFF